MVMIRSRSAKEHAVGSLHILNNWTVPW